MAQFEIPYMMARLLLLLSLFGGALSEYCPMPFPMLCVGSTPYCCGYSSKPNSLYCCGDCLLRYHDPCSLSTPWVVTVAVVAAFIIAFSATFVLYCCCCRRSRNNHHHHHEHHHRPTEYTVITATATAPPFPANAASLAPNGAPPYHSSSYIPQSHSYVQTKPTLYSYGTIGASSSANFGQGTSNGFAAPAPPPPYAPTQSKADVRA